MMSIKSIILMLVTTFMFLFHGLTDVYALEESVENESIENKSLALTGITDSKVAINTNSSSHTGISMNETKADVLTNTGNTNGQDSHEIESENNDLKALNEDSSTNDLENQLKTQEDFASARYFYVTAYYSPVPGQKRYITGSFEGDVKLNGEGKHTASGKQVFSGLLAAPGNYKFGTKIELEGVGVGEVADRGGAIVRAGTGSAYDRIDVWMGYGEDGLYRALKWGKRKVKGKVVPNTRLLSIELANAAIYKYGELTVDAENPVEENVKDLQNLFTELKLYTGAIDGNFETIKNNLIDYQIKAKIISGNNDSQAGYFGPKTLAALREEFGSDVFKKQNNNLDEDVVLSGEVKTKLDILNNKVSLMIDKKYGKNTPKALEYREKLRTAIEKQTKKIRNQQRKNQLKYLRSVL